MKEMVIFSGTSNPELAKRIADYLKIPLGEIEISRFSEGEIFVRINQDIRGRDVFVVQSTCPPANENMMELLIIMDAIVRASGARLTVVLPFYGYARQDRKDRPRVPITAKLVANLITAAGADRVLTMDLHADQIQGFFDIPLDHLFSAPVFIRYLKDLNLKNRVIVTPDVGGIKRARAFATRLGADLAIVDKRRVNATDAEVLHLIGDVRGKAAIIVDDMIATAGSLAEAAKIVHENGASEIYATAAHAILSGPAVERIQKAHIKELLVTDSIPLKDKKLDGKIKVLTVSELLGEAIRRIHENESVSSLFL
ncbi:MAG: ribose-phosphate pyrophosphokinase [Chlamydiae bacterium]|nr:ribose-phosphate pyrophosphokinase [Chlamydiota bacterium]MBI3266189.1 ribose-phosphate pyrophosphokinase [Chlamydiota bacterium]